MKSITTLTKADLEGKRVVLRLDLNVPVADGKVTDDFRIISALPTIKYLQDNGAQITVIAHCEANKEGESCTLKPAAGLLGEHVPLEFVQTIEEAKIYDGDKIVVIENLRQYEGEKRNEPTFAKELAFLGDIYVNEAFSVSHREHASIVGVPKLLPSYAGLQLEKEVTTLSKAFNPPHPFIFILGGAKFDTKLPLIEKFMDKADNIFIGGALANDILKASGTEVKQSLVSSEIPDLSSVINNPKLIPVTDVVWDGEAIVDIGSETMRVVEEKVRDSAFVLWNGPLGHTEGGFEQATVSLAQAIADSKAESILGGGDTLSAIKSLGLLDHFTFISTGGGATLDFLANETLPGIEALD
jgi:phosphoglycerate kinase